MPIFEILSSESDRRVLDGVSASFGYQFADLLYPRLAKEEQSGNWLYNIDQLAPLEI